MRTIEQGITFFVLFFSFCSSSWAQELPDCRELWAKEVQSGEIHYNFTQDSQLTTEGNIGYSWADKLKRSQCKKDWAVLIYMAADNDLRPYALADVYEMEAGFESGRYAGSTLRSDVIVEMDTDIGEKARRLHIFQTPDAYDPSLDKETLMGWKPENIKSPVVEWVDKTKSHTERLEAFLRWGIKKYPAKHYMVVIWGHGQGWTSIVNSELDVSESRKFGGLAFDQKAGGYLDIPNLSDILKRTSLEGSGKRFDLYVSDACLMQMLEVAYELKDSARFIVGSAQVHNYFGLPYRRILYELNRGSFLGERQDVGAPDGDEAYLLAKMLPKIFKSSMNSRGFKGLQALLDPNGYKQLTMSSLNSDALENRLVPEIWRLGESLLDYARSKPLRKIEIMAAIDRTLEFSEGLKDFASFLSELKFMLWQERNSKGNIAVEVERLTEQIHRTQDALNESIVSYAIGEDFIEKKYAGSMKAVSLWLPANKKALDQRLEDFSKSNFYKQSRPLPWPQILSEIYQ